MEQIATNTAVHDAVTYDITVNGQTPDAGLQLLSLLVTKEINRIPVARMVFRDGSAADQTFSVSSEDLFVPGAPVVIRIGRDSNNMQVFKGIVIKHGIRIRENGNTELHVECRDEAVRMTVGRHSRYFENMSDNMLFDALIQNHPNLVSNPQSTSPVYREIVQHHITDWDFLLLRAEACGMLVTADDGTVSVFAPDTGSGNRPVFTVTYGISVLELEAEMDARNQWKKVTADSWDYSSQGLFTADTDSTNFTENGDISGADLAGAMRLDAYQMHHSGHLIEQELQDWVNGIMLRSRMAKIRGRVKFQGSTGVVPGNMIDLEGLGGRFNGKVFVTAVRHEVGNGQWDTHVQFGLDPRRYAEVHNEDIHDPGSAGLIGMIGGLQIGKVVQLQNDPDGEDRILVKVPTIDNAARGIWTRVASLDAGKDRGAFFRPEIDDEVIVGFINDDPRHAVMLGMLNSSAKPAPIAAQDINDKKGFTTRSKMHISIDDGTKTITIDTPAGNSITLDESGQKIELSDQNGNTITMDPTGISLQSPMEIQINAGTDLTLSAGASLSIGGVSISANADGVLSLNGDGSTTLSSSGVTTITGSLVTIN
ncbi:MAG TPA: type VI secretion system tip protein VgrG [Puia sp.]|nr:type VI secretion system tip protein VgrG [Puia sp.]